MDSDILSSSDMNDEPALSLCRELWLLSSQGISGPYVFNWEPGIALQEIEVPYVLDWEPGIALHAMHWNLASSWGKGEVS